MAILNQNPAFGQSPNKNVRDFPILESSFLMNVHYDPNTMQATVTMKGGGQYVYYMVYPMVMDQWMQSPSKGKFFAQNIRGKFKMRARIINKTVGPRRDYGNSTAKPHTRRASKKGR